MAKTFEREELEEDGNRYIYFRPTTPHPWLESVYIVENPHGEGPVVFVNFPEGDASEAVVKQDEKLRSLRTLFEKLPVADLADSVGIHETVDFNAGPQSKIRSVLQQSDIPRDISKAVMEELQRIWAKTPD